MGIEIERKFLVAGSGWRSGQPVQLKQGYLTRSNERVVRIRTEDEQAFITVKGAATGISRAEYEYPIPYEDAVALLEHLCLKPLIVKTRYLVPHAGFTWHVDEYHEPRADLVVAEIELARIDEPFELPDWIGAEVSGDPAYYNHNMILAVAGSAE
jgi:adenylate cyclase